MMRGAGTPWLQPLLRPRGTSAITLCHNGSRRLPAATSHASRDSDHVTQRPTLEAVKTVKSFALFCLWCLLVTGCGATAAGPVVVAPSTAAAIAPPAAPPYTEES